jgi:hypothetical protein
MFWFIDAVDGTDVDVTCLGDLVAQDHGDCFLGSSTMEEMQGMACHADMAGHKVTLAKVERWLHEPRYRLYVA